MKISKLMLIGLLSISLLTGCVKEKESQPEELTKSNTNEGIIKNQEVEVFKMENISLVYENESTTLETTVTNTSNETAYLKEFQIEVKDREGNIMETLIGFIGDNLQAGETKVITSSCKTDLTSATSIEYTVIH